MLTSRERIFRAFCLEEPDKVPVFEQEIQPPVSDMLLGRICSLADKRLNIRILERGYLSTSLLEQMVKDHIELATELNLDAVNVSANMRPGKCEAIKRISAREWVNERGTIRYSLVGDRSYRVDLRIREKGKEGLRERIEELREPIDICPDDFYVLRRVKHEIERRNLDLFVFTASVVFDWHGAGWTDLALKWLLTEPGLMHKYLDAYNRRAIGFVKAAIDFGAEGVLDGGDLAYRHGPMISPKAYVEFILPYQKRRVDTFHRKGAFVVNRSDGWIWPIAHDFLENSGVDGYCEIDKSAGMDLGELKEVYGDRLCLLGNVNCAGALVNGTTGDVTKETEECIQKAAPGGGYILCSSNVIHSHVRPENYLAMLDACRKCGKYGYLA